MIGRRLNLFVMNVTSHLVFCRRRSRRSPKPVGLPIAVARSTKIGLPCECVKPHEAVMGLQRMPGRNDITVDDVETGVSISSLGGSDTCRITQN